MRLFAAGLCVETNTFSPIPTGLEDFTVKRSDPFSSVNDSGFDLYETWGRAAEQRGYEFIGSLMASASPSGKVVKTAYETLRDAILNDLRAAKPVEVVLLMLHGAMVAEGYDDCEEDMIRHVREIVGSNCVIAVELDLHCHLSPSKIADADIVVTYKEYPHSDVNERAEELLNLAMRAHSGELHPTTALFDCRMMGLYPTTREPMRSFVDEMVALERDPRILSISFGHGFQFADLPHMGAKVIAVTNNDPGLAQRIAADVGLRVHGLRHRIGFDSISVPMNDALTKALTGGQTPVVVADQSDNTGSGAPGDTMHAIRWLLEHEARSAAAAIIYDPAAVRIARKAGKGAHLAIRLGGKAEPSSGEPLDLEVTVTALRDNYHMPLAQGVGKPLLYPVGDVAALRCQGIDIIVGSLPCQCISPAIFADFGIEPRGMQLLVVKSYQHFCSGFAPIAGEIIYMASPGAVPPDPRMLTYRRLNTSLMFPWVDHPFAPNQLPTGSGVRAVS